MAVRLGDVFGQSFSLFGRHFLVFIGLAAIVLSPFYLMLLAAVVLRPGGNLPYVVVNLAVVMMLVICPTMANGAMAYGVVQDLGGRPVRMSGTLKVLVRRVRPMIGIAISLIPLVPVGVLFAWIASRVLALAFPLALADPRYPIGLFILLQILGYGIYFAAAPICVVEQTGVGVSLSRSKALTRGHRRQICAAFILIVIADAIVSVTARMLAGLIGADTERLIASYIVQAVFLAFIAVVAAVIYDRLRDAETGGDIAGVFD